MYTYLGIRIWWGMVLMYTRKGDDQRTSCRVCNLNPLYPIFILCEFFILELFNDAYKKTKTTTTKKKKKKKKHTHTQPENRSSRTHDHVMYTSLNSSFI